MLYRCICQSMQKQAKQQDSKIKSLAWSLDFPYLCLQELSFISYMFMSDVNRVIMTSQGCVREGPSRKSRKRLGGLGWSVWEAGKVERAGGFVSSCSLPGNRGSQEVRTWTLSLCLHRTHTPGHKFCWRISFYKEDFNEKNHSYIILLTILIIHKCWKVLRKFSGLKSLSKTKKLSDGSKNTTSKSVCVCMHVNSQHHCIVIFLFFR